MKSATARIEATFLDSRKPLLQLLKRRLGCSHAAEDLVQEAYLRVIQQESIEEISNLPAYLFRVASNLLLDQRRQAQARSLALHDSLEDDLVCPRPAPDRIAEASQELQQLGQLIAELPPQCRRIFLMHKVEQLSHAEIAERLGISPRTVETQIGKALRLLRDRLLTRG